MNQADRIVSINEPGWDGLDANVQKFRVRNLDEQKKIDILFHRVFTSKDGKKILEHLTTRYLDQPAWVPNADPSYGYAREGQNSIVREIITRIRRANEPS